MTTDRIASEVPMEFLVGTRVVMSPAMASSLLLTVQQTFTESATDYMEILSDTSRESR